MENTEVNPVSDRLFRHMAWANSQTFSKLSGIPSDAYKLSLPNDDWSVSAIVQHLVGAAGRYASRLDGEAYLGDLSLPTSAKEISHLAELCVTFDARLRLAATLPEEDTVRESGGKFIHRARSTILGQAIHHATEHRAQIASILTMHGVHGLDLDELDLWAYGDAEGLGS